MNQDALRLLAGRAIVARVLADEIAALVAAVRDAIEPELDAEEKVRAQLPDGTVVGTVSRSRLSTRGKVTDPAALLAWVEANHPEEIVRSVSPAYVKKLEASAKRHGEAVDETTGEIVPGVEIALGGSSYLPKVGDDARDLVMARLSELLAGGLLALPGSDR